MVQRPEFRTDRLSLRPFRSEDLPYLLEYTLKDYFWEFLPLEPQTPDSVKSFLDQRLHDDWGKGSYHCIIELIDKKHVIGTVRISIKDTTHLSGDIGYALNADYSGRGYMTEAVSRILQIGTDELGLHRIWATADVKNDASWRLMERVGMEREGLLRHHHRIRGSWRDSYLYSILSKKG
ncbi:MAG: GNAT family protein [Pseudomonadota bacterium]